MPDNNLFFALSNSTPGKDAEFNEWYDTHHIREVPETWLGFISGRRFRLNPLQRSGEGAGAPSPWQYLAIYQLDPSIDSAAIHQHGRDHPGRTVPAGDTLSDDHVAWTWEPIGLRLVARRPNPIAGAQQHVLLALTNPAPGREEEFNDWYDNHHLPEALEAIPGRVAAQRYGLAAGQRQDQWQAAVPGHAPDNDERRPDQWLPWRYLALYELESDDVAAMQEADAQVRAAGTLTPSKGALDPTFAVWLFSALPDPAWRTPEPRTATGAPA
jgi:hypothetical protein